VLGRETTLSRLSAAIAYARSAVQTISKSAS
jgi:hypothetical protein